ncbi:homoserine kinase [Arachidicoccus rhizosphaerae]|jgi:homoserine kinase|uniref:Homoserine kinase n=1 Tax=Arachidicoccus rhizosphaerae TaxID=551991 RepID=A0A1H4C067_9BACT|nr:homoserine kinase [Arachidicoccus rhizosphaerae]SEA53766.1 homoserine kinase [Arachidicoccus rhizosphaerae]
MKACIAYAPGTVANLVCGFDILGLCLDSPADKMEVRLLDTAEIIIKSADGYPLPEDPALNTAGAPLLEMLQDLDQKVGFEIIIHKRIKPGSGIGSSAASAAGAVAAANYLLGSPFDKVQQIQYAMAGEKVASGVKHADNVAPCIYGGITLIRSIAPLDVIPLAAPDLYVSVVHPQIEVRTADARAILRQQVPLKNAIKQWGNIAGLVTGILKNDLPLIGRSLEDHIIEPVRSTLIPGFQELKKSCKEAGALGGGISGSGPSIFMLSSSRQTAQAIEGIMQETYKNLGIDYHSYVSMINKEGVRIEPLNNSSR